MDCALWLNRRKIYSAAEIPQNLDIASLRGYFLAGSLLSWLNEHGGERFAEKLAGVPADAPDLNEKLAEIFGGAPVKNKDFGGKLPSVQNGFVPFSSFGGLSGSGIGSFELGSYRLPSSGSYNYEFFTSFGSLSNICMQLFGGSFGFGSFGYGSGFGEWEWEWERLLKYGSFGFGSFAFGLIPEWLGSFRYIPDEYDLIMLETLMRCPLDRFGYGIHLIF